MTRPPHRTLLRSGHVYSPASPRATAMVVEGGTVAWVGSDEAAAGFADGVDETVDLDGAFVAPAFVDAHVHATSTGLVLDGLDLAGCTSRAQVLGAVTAHARAHQDGVVLGHGWDETRWADPRPPTGDELERAAPGRAVYLSRVDVHSALVSPALLDQVPDARRAEGFDPSGHLTRESHHAARRAAYATVTPAQREAAQRATLRRAASVGIGCVHEMSGPDIAGADDLAGLLRLVSDEPGPDVLGYWGELGGAERARELGALGAAGDLFADGALGSHTACLRTVYADAHGTGAAYVSAAQVRDHVVACAEAGLQAGFHAIGDAALDVVVAGFAEAAEKVGPERVRAGRHRVEHAEMLDADLLARMAALGLVASVQPAFDAAWGGESGMYAERLGAARALTLNPYADMAAAGVPLAFGSDSPVTPLAPWATVRAAAWHHVPAQRLSVRAAFAAHTRGGWRAAGYDEAGVLTPGAPATYAVWEADALAVQAPDTRVAAWSTDPRSGTPGLPDLALGTDLPTCRRTVVRGTTVFAREGSREGTLT